MGVVSVSLIVDSINGELASVRGSNTSLCEGASSGAVEPVFKLSGASGPDEEGSCEHGGESFHVVASFKGLRIYEK